VPVCDPTFSGVPNACPQLFGLYVLPGSSSVTSESTFSASFGLLFLRFLAQTAPFVTFVNRCEPMGGIFGARTCQWLNSVILASWPFFTAILPHDVGGNPGYCDSPGPLGAQYRPARPEGWCCLANAADLEASPESTRASTLS